MKRLQALWRAISSRATSPLVLGFFLLLYVGFAFVTDDTLVYLMEVTSKSVLLTLVLALLPLNIAARILVEGKRYVERRRIMRGQGVLAGAAPLFDESLSLGMPEASDAGDLVAALREQLTTRGYRTASSAGVLSASKGVSRFPLRLLFLGGAFCLFGGILVSFTTRSTHRFPLVEGEPLPTGIGGGGVVEAVRLDPGKGAILAKDLIIRITSPETGGAKHYTLYPPSLLRGFFVYPRYLGIAALVDFSAPGIQRFEHHAILNIYPPGREDRVPVSGSPFQIVFSMADSGDGSDPYMTGKISFRFKILRGEGVVAEGMVPGRGEYTRNGYRIAVPDMRRMVITDFIGDYGVLLIWMSAAMLLAAACGWLPVALFLPCRQMLFSVSSGAVVAFSRSEGENRAHASLFHELLDLVETCRIGRERSPEQQ